MFHFLEQIIFKTKMFVQFIISGQKMGIESQSPASNKIINIYWEISAARKQFGYYKKHKDKVTKPKGNLKNSSKNYALRKYVAAQT